MTIDNQKSDTEKNNRREFLLKTALFGGSLVLGGEIFPTPASGQVDETSKRLLSMSTKTSNPTSWKATEDNILGPYHRPRAPYRAMIAPPLAPGKILIVQGRIWGIDTRKPLSGVIIDIWQADHSGSYDNDDRDNPPNPHTFDYRARLISDETGYYEFQTIRPGRYKVGKSYRPSHIHYLIRAKGYKQLITQLYFEGDPYNKVDPFIKNSLIIKPKAVTTNSGTYEKGVFDIILENL